MLLFTFLFLVYLFETVASDTADRSRGGGEDIPRGRCCLPAPRARPLARGGAAPRAEVATKVWLAVVQ